jgi:hypothetical protein
MWSGKKELSDMIIILFGIGKDFEIVTISLKGRHVLSTLNNIFTLISKPMQA